MIAHFVDTDPSPDLQNNGEHIEKLRITKVVYCQRKGPPHIVGVRSKSRAFGELGNDHLESETTCEFVQIG